MSFAKIVLLLIFFIAIIFSIYSFMIWTPSEKMHWVNIYGKIIPNDETSKLYDTDVNAYLDRRPSLIEIYTYNPARSPIPFGDRLSISDIDWKNKTGDFSLSFILPVPMKVVLTAHCSNYTILELDYQKSQIETDVYWGTNCMPYKETSVSNVPSDEIDILNREITHVQSLLVDFSTKNDAERKLIDEDLSRANGLRDDAKRSNSWESLKYALQGHWLVLRAEYRIRLSELGQCVEDGRNILGKFNSLYFVPSYEIKEKLNASFNTYRSFNSTNILYNSPFRTDDSSILTNDIKFFDRQTNDVYDDIYDCKQNVALLNKAFNYQVEFYNQRNVFLVVLIFVSLLTGALIESYLRFFGKTFNAISKDISKSKIIYNKIFLKEKQINKQTITTILTFDGGFSLLNIFFLWSNINPIFFISALYSLLFLVGGLFFAFMSLRYDNKTVKYLAWIFSIVGIATIVALPIIWFIGISFNLSITWFFEKLSNIIPKAPTF